MHCTWQGKNDYWSEHSNISNANMFITFANHQTRRDARHEILTTILVHIPIRSLNASPVLLQLSSKIQRTPFGEGIVLNRRSSGYLISNNQAKTLSTTSQKSSTIPDDLVVDCSCICSGLDNRNYFNSGVRRESNMSRL